MRLVLSLFSWVISTRKWPPVSSTLIQEVMRWVLMKLQGGAGMVGVGIVFGGLGIEGGHGVHGDAERAEKQQVEHGHQGDGAPTRQGDGESHDAPLAAWGLAPEPVNVISDST